MTLIILLFAIGILFIAVEVIIPGAILGTIGGILLFAGCIAAFVEYGTAGGLVALAAALLLAGAALWFEFRILPKTRIGRRAFLQSAITEVSNAHSSGWKDLVGKPAEAVTLLSPTGYVLIEGKRYEAASSHGQVPAGTPLTVIAADSFRIVVSPIPDNPPTETQP